MIAADLIEKLNTVMAEVGWELHQFTAIHELSKAYLDRLENDKRYPVSSYELEKDRKVIAAVGGIKRVQEKRVGCDLDTMEYVYYFENHDIFLRIQGYYSSWDGVDFRDAKWQEVVGREIVTTIYEVVS